MNTAIGLLMLAMSLLQAVKDNPNLPPDVQQNAITTANQAIAYSTAFLAQNTPKSVVLTPITDTPVTPTPTIIIQQPQVTASVAQTTTPTIAMDPFQFTDQPVITLTCTDGVCTANLDVKTNYPSTVKVQFAASKKTPFGTPQFESTEEKTETTGSWQVGSGVYQVLITANSDGRSIEFQTQISG